MTYGKVEASADFRTRDIMMATVLELQPALEADGVRHPFLFGSVARWQDVLESDVDVVVDLNPKGHIKLFRFASIRECLRMELGREVDLGTRRSLVPGRHDEIIADLVEAF